jgi:hypothetical protein
VWQNVGSAVVLQTRLMNGAELTKMLCADAAMYRGELSKCSATLKIADELLPLSTTSGADQLSKWSATRPTLARHACL